MKIGEEKCFVSYILLDVEKRQNHSFNLLFPSRLLIERIKITTAVWADDGITHVHYAHAVMEIERRSLN